MAATSPASTAADAARCSAGTQCPLPPQDRSLFSVDPLLDGSGVSAPADPSVQSMPVETIDRAIAYRKLAGPFGIKLDTHGFELPVLQGAALTLEKTELLIIEAYNFKLTPGCLRFHELYAWLEARGFRCCDLADPMRRPGDGVLWQIDFAFARATSPLFASNEYVPSRHAKF